MTGDSLIFAAYWHNIFGQKTNITMPIFRKTDRFVCAII
jgi:hypothetical protein